MTVTDVLIGSDMITVKREGRENDVEFEKEDDETILGIPDVYDEEVVEAVNEAGFDFKSQFPLEFNYYVNDESVPSEYRLVADEIGLPEDDETVQRIANIGYEIELTIRVEDRHTWKVTHVFGHELKEPKSYSAF